ncbi:MAG: hypothetical protein ACK5TN_08055 [Acidobacteriota bacterium]
MSYRLIEQDWLCLSTSEPAPRLAAELYEQRLAGLRDRMRAEDFRLALVYGDREHFANLHYFTNFDPRFEEALLLVGRSGPPLLLVGNECQAYLPISPLWKASGLRAELYRPFSLEDQTRTITRTLEQILAGEGAEPGARLALIGAKTHGEESRSDLPSYIVDAARATAGYQQCLNRSGWLIDAQDGLRVQLSAADIALFEINNTKASEAMRRMHYQLRPGITDHELMAESIAYDGTPLSCHMTCKTGPNRVSLASASGNRIERGHTWSANVAYWGANICRANWIAESEAELPVAARDYIGAFAGPYFLALAAWLETLAIGASGGEMYELTKRMLPDSQFHIELNPGHHIGYDEWPSAPVWEGSKVELRSGMVLQSDVIPSHPVYFSTRMEDGYALADEALRGQIEREHPESWRRMELRREFLRARLGITLQPSVLPLSNCGGLIAPWGLSPATVFARG